jgi:hypothetical protein
MTKQEAFNKFLKDNNLTAKNVPAEWPYNYGDNTAQVVTFKGLTQYFYFNDEGQMLVRKEIK